MTDFSIAVRGTPFDAFTGEPFLGGLPAANLGNVFAGGIVGRHALRVDAAGALAPDAPAAGDRSAVDAEKLLDVMLYLEYRLTTAP